MSTFMVVNVVHPRKSQVGGFSKYPPLIIKYPMKTYPTRVYLANLLEMCPPRGDISKFP